MDKTSLSSKFEQHFNKAVDNFYKDPNSAANQIPNTNNLILQFQQNLEAVKLISTQIELTGLVDKKVTKHIEKGSENIIESLLIINNNLDMVNMTLSQINPANINNILKNFAIDPIASIKAFKKGELYKSKKPDFLTEYLNLISVIGQINYLGMDLDTKNIKKTGKFFKSALKSIIDIQKYINKKAKYFKVPPVTIFEYLDKIPILWSKLGNNISLMSEFYNSTQAVNPKLVKIAVKNIFSCYLEILWGVLDIASILLSGEISQKKFLFFKTKRKFKYSDLILGLASMAGLILYFNKLMPITIPIFNTFIEISNIGKKKLKSGVKIYFGTLITIMERINTTSWSLNYKNLISAFITVTLLKKFILYSSELFYPIIELGQYKKDLENGLLSYDILFYGKDRFLFNDIPSILQIVDNMTNWWNFTKGFLNAIIVLNYLNIISTLITPTVIALVKIGPHYGELRSGLKSFALIFNGDDNFLPWAEDIPSIIKTIQSIKKPFSKGLILTALKTIPLVIALNVITTIIIPTVNSLAMIGTRFKYIKLGLQSFGMIFMGDGYFNPFTKNTPSIVKAIQSLRNPLKKKLIFNTLRGIEFLIAFNVFITLLTPALGELILLGYKHKYIQQGLRTLFMIFNSKKSKLPFIKNTPSVIETIQSLQAPLDNKLISNTFSALRFLTRFNTFMVLLIPAISELILLGAKYKYAKRGLKTLFLIFNGKKSKLPFIKNTPSVIETIQSLQTPLNNKLISNTFEGLKFLILLNQFMLLLIPTIASLILLGYKQKYVKRGLRTLFIIFNGKKSKYPFIKNTPSIFEIIDSIQDIDFNKTSKILIKLILVTGLLDVLCVELSFFAVLALPLTLATAALLALKLSLVLLIFNLKYVLRYKNLIDKGIPVLQKIIVIFGQLITLLSAFLSKLSASKIDWKQVAISITLLIGTISVMITASILIGLLEKKQLISKGLHVLRQLILSFSGCVALLTILLEGKVTEWKTMWISLTMFVGMIAIMATAAIVINLFENKIKKGSATMAILAGAYTAFASALIFVGGKEDKIQASFNTAIIVVSILGVLALMAILISKKSIKIQFGIFTAISIGLSMIIIAGTLIVINKIVDKINFLTILEFIGIFSVVILAVAGVGFIAQYILPVIAIAVICIIGVSIALTLFAETLKIANSVADFDAAVESTTKMIDTFGRIIGVICSLNIGDILEATLTIGSLSYISWQLSNMASNIADIASLKYATDWDKNGKPTKYLQMTTEDFIKASTNAAAVASFLSAIVGDKVSTITVNGKQIKISGITNQDNITLSAVWKFKRLKRISKQLSKMASNIADIANLTIATKWNNEGDPIKFRAMTADDFINASLNAITIAHFLAALTGDKATVLKVAGRQIKIKGITNTEEISASAVWKFMQLNMISFGLSRMASNIADIANLKVATKWDKDGNPLDTRQMVANDFLTAAINASSIVHFMCALLKPGITQLKVAGKMVSISGIPDMKAIKLKTVLKFEGLRIIVSAIGTMAETITDVANLKYVSEYNKDGTPKAIKKMTDQDFKEASKNAMTVTGFFVNFLNSNEMKEFIDKDLDDAAENLDVLRILGSSIGGMIDGIGAITSGQFPEKFDPKTGQPISYVNLNKILSNRQQLIDTIRNILTIYIDAINSSSITEANDVEANVVDGGSLIGKMVNKVAGGVKKLVNGGGPIEKAGNVLTQLQSIVPIVTDMISGVMNLDKNKSLLSPQKSESIIKKIRSAISIYVNAVNGFDNSNMPLIKQKVVDIQYLGNFYKKLIESLTANDGMDIKSAENVQKIEKQKLENITKFIDKANTIDTEKIQTLSNLFQQMSEFSQSINGNFEKLADVLNDKLVDILNKLYDVLHEANNSEVLQNNEKSKETKTNNVKETQETSTQSNSNEGLQGLKSTIDDIQNILSQMQTMGISISNDSSNPLYVKDSNSWG